MDSTTADALSWKKEGLATLREDPKKAILLLVKAGRALTKDGENKEAGICLERVIKILQRELSKTKTIGETQKPQTKESSLEQRSLSLDSDDTAISRSSLVKSDSLESGDGIYGSDRPDRNRDSSKQQRAKRTRMEKLKQMYRHYETQRGTKDLYQTMLKSYGEYLNAGYDLDQNVQANCLPSQEAMMKRDLVLTELADTERDYVSDLEHVSKNIIPAFSSADAPVGLQTASQIIFGNLEEIYEWHKSVFLERLEDCLEEPDLLGSSFTEEEEHLSTMYAEYCQNKPKADDLMKDYEEDIDVLYASHFGTDKLHLRDYLIKPVQRLMKYQLLLQNIVKYTEKTGEDASAMADALEVMEIVPKRANDKMNVALIQHGMDKNLLDFELIFQDNLEVTFGRSRAKPRKMRAFLFEEFLIFTEPIEREGRLPIYRFVMEGKTLRMGLTESVENDKLKFAIWFRKFKTSDIFICRAESPGRKESWLQVLTDLISAQLGHRGSITREPSELVRRRTQRPKTWSAEALVRQATFGHPREGSMSAKLKKSIEKFVMEELFVGGEPVEMEDVKKYAYQRSNSMKEEIYVSYSSDSEKESPKGKSPVNGDGADLYPDSNEPTSCDENNNKVGKTEEHLINTNAIEINVDNGPRQHKLSVVWEGDLGLGTETILPNLEPINNNDSSSLEQSQDGNNCTPTNEQTNVSPNLPNGYIYDPGTEKVTSGEDDGDTQIDMLHSSIRKDRASSESAIKISSLTTTPVERAILLVNETTYERRRSFSSPAILNYSLRKESDDLDYSHPWCVFSMDELSQCKSMLAEAEYLLGSVYASEKPGTAFQLFDSALEFFFDVSELKTFSEIHDRREDLLKRCTSLYQSLKADKAFSRFKNSENTEFFGYHGLFSILNSYGRSVRESQPLWAIVLYSLAVTSATTESSWTDAWKIFQKLAQLYRQQGVYNDAVDSLIDAHYIQLETGDLLAACRDLETAFKTAVSARVFEKCIRLESLAEVLVDNLQHCSMDSEASVLTFFSNMSKALRTEDREWFEINGDILESICLRSKNGDAVDIQRIFSQLRQSFARQEDTR